MQFKIRDLRKKDQYKLDDKYINGYAKLCGVYATAVYNSLSRHAQFNSQECFPSIKLIAEQHGVSRTSVIKGIKKLEDYGIIKIIKEKAEDGKQKNNIYILIDKTEWVSIRVQETDSESRVQEKSKPSPSQDKSRVHEVVCKDTKIKDNKDKVCRVNSAGEEISEIIFSFKEVNPSYKKYFGNTTQRKAVERMLEVHGKEELINIISYLEKSNKVKYAPTITTPVQLEDNMGKLMAWSQKLKEDKKEIIGLN